MLYCAGGVLALGLLVGLLDLSRLRQTTHSDDRGASVHDQEAPDLGLEAEQLLKFGTAPELRPVVSVQILLGASWNLAGSPDLHEHTPLRFQKTHSKYTVGHDNPLSSSPSLILTIFKKVSISLG